jgi:hypothetical protein
MRIAGSEDATTAKAWEAVDDAMLQRIARSSMEQLAAFLTSPEVAPRPADEPRLALAGDRATPEAAGIFRLSHADPLPSGATRGPADAQVPLPPRRPHARTARDGAAATRLAAAGR